jgi:pilus assembly protein CpaC
MVPARAMVQACRAFRLLGPVAILLLVLIDPAQAQSTAGAAAVAGGAPLTNAPPDADLGRVELLVGRSTVLNVGAPIARVSLTKPEVADAIATSSQQLLIHGKSAGSISLFVWDRAGGIKKYEINVQQDLSRLTAQMRQLFPGEQIAVTGSGRDIVIAGTVSSKYVIEKAAEVAAGYVEKKENVVNLLRQQEGVATNQVLLRVRFAEVSRLAVTELGASLFTGAGGYRDYVARTTTEQFAAPNFEEMLRSSIQGVDKWGGGRDTVDATGGKTTFSDFLNLFLFNNRYNVGTLVRALQNKGLFQSLAEPNLVAENGKEASFLAGGEYPYPAVQGSAATLAVTIVFKEYGIRLNFTPTITGNDLIHLKVRPEVSSLDFSNAVTYQGFRIPALTTRRAETEVELQDGQTFAIAGLMNNTMTSTMQKIPGIGDIPILGLLFKSKAAQKSQTELVVLITPQILRRNSPGAASGLPHQMEPYLAPPSKTVPPPPPWKAPEPGVQEASTATPTAPPASTASPLGAPSPLSAPPVPPPAVAPVVTPPPPPVSAPASAAPPPVAASRSVQPAPPVAQAAALAPPQPAPQPIAAPAPPAPDPRTAAQAQKELKKQQEIQAKQREEEAKRLEAQRREDEKRGAERAKADQERLKQAQKDAQKAERERAKLEAAAAKKAAEDAKKQAEADRKRTEELAEAQERLKAAQAAYAAAVKGNK